MPKQHTLFGRPIPRFTARRLASLLLCLSLLAITLIALVTGAVLSSPARVAYHSNIAAPRSSDARSQTVLTPFRPLSHRPPRQNDDEYAGASWWADWKWLSVPFSSSLTFDNDRALLPPLTPRQPIYCYYDAAANKPLEEKHAESELLLTWRRAWWARGFRPLILSPAEAMQHPSYARLKRLDMEPAVRKDLTRWLAWHTVGGGILAHYTLLPTATDDNPALSSLRRGEFPYLTRWKDLGDALLVGQEDDVGAVIEHAIQPAKLRMLETGMTDLPGGLIEIDKTPAPLASYTQSVVGKKYPKVALDFKKGRARGLRSLNKLITTHLHIFWQNRFPEGIEVLKPHPEHTTAMIRRAVKLALQLASCSESPMPSTCPPNHPRCAPCVATAPMRVSTPARYRNSRKVFSIGTVPHPWTFALLDNLQESFNISWIRRESARDPWLTAVTQALLGAGASGNRRVMSLKEAIAGEHATSRSLWLVAENEMPVDISWYFGFAVPEHGMDQGKSESPVPAVRLMRKKAKAHQPGNGPVASKGDLALEAPLLERARHVVAQTKATEETRMRASLEAWNMADTETWKFVRAFQARNAKEKDKWEMEEAKFGSGAGTEKFGQRRGDGVAEKTRGA
ncbi:hypothetical protein HRG_007916 [Hirsutella rhossiliensis]|uniref:Uncharacterized protein n=1 Tax=Hirsutella rhossiliensis TaxID=111463 RepID=A0A9P8MR74_9HYPO|nr:uncharacterized protein HRG_07916 [Hirsutella rhossiliensis]KAH0960763.1 hypothetical protein HRG_07916 [Hirsutella rhossiliensis]